MQSALCVILPVRLSVTNAATISTSCWRTQCRIRPWCTQKIRPPVQILKFLAIDVKLFTLNLYNNITKNGPGFIIKRLHVCAATATLLMQLQAASCNYFWIQNCHLYIFEIWIMMWFPVRIRNISKSQKDLFLHLAELKASMTVEKSNFWSKSLSMFNRDRPRLYNHSWLESRLSLEQIWCVWGDRRSGARQYKFTAKLVKIMSKMPNCQSQIFTAKRLWRNATVSVFPMSW